ncbi:hypothetical protein DH2020_043265 [Rehmannia glutinosa]|uniref:Uncharacterized protein n=1 Tax=Rehmannia glutinosa TaxID=99300 RepID=A0ABR0UKW2_REHGL
MAVANAWATGHSAVPPRHLRRPSSSPETLNQFFKKKFLLNLPNKFLIRRSNNFDLSCRCSNNFEESKNYSDSGNNNISSYSSSSAAACSSSSSSADWDWNTWTRHFSEIEQAENYASVLKFQLEDAIEKEDFQEAAKLKKAIVETTSGDSIAEIMSELKSAIEEERYNDASRLCEKYRKWAGNLLIAIAGCINVGWWVGYSKDLDDPFGRLIRITPGTGRFIGKSYSPRQLVTSSPGTPLFEIFVVKDANEGYNMQVAFLKPIKGNSANSSSSSDKSAKGPSVGETQNASVIDVKLEENEVEKGEGKSIDLEGAAEEGIKSVINFLKEKIPELKVKVMRVDVTEDITEDTVKQFIEEDNENQTNEDIKEEATDIDSNQPDRVAAQGDSDTMEDESNLDMKLYIGASDIKDMERDSFVLHIPKRYQDNEPEENVAAKVKVAAVAAQGVSNLCHLRLPRHSGVRIKFPLRIYFLDSGMNNILGDVSRDVREIVKLAVSQAQKRNRFSEYTNFSRITTSSGDLDPFDGLYVGAFGPYGTEVVQLRRKYGNWNMNNEEKPSDVEFFEYVEAVKLTGDLNVPAGQVTFRAKVGKGNRLANRGLYPHELGVCTDTAILLLSYKGQGRIAEFGFKNPKWVEGELLQMNGKGLGPYVKGAVWVFFTSSLNKAFSCCSIV